MDLDSLAQATVSFVVAGFLLLRGRQEESHASALWGWGWVFFGASQSAAAILIYIIRTGGAESLARSAVSLASTVFVLCAATLLYLGLRAYRSGRVFALTELWLVLICLATVALITTLATAPLTASARLFWRVGVVRSLFVGVAFATLGVGSIRADQTPSRIRHRFLFGTAATAWGLYLVSYFLLTAWNLYIGPIDLSYRVAVQPLETGLWALLAMGMFTWISGEEETKRQRAEADLREAKKHEALAMLSGGVAHEFNNLSQAIHLAAESVKVAVATRDHAGQSRALEIIFGCCQQVGGMTRALLEYSRASHSNEKSGRGTADLNATLESHSHVLHFVIPNNIELSIHVLNRKVLVPISEMDLRTVILNLCVNARDAMPAGGRLDLSVSLSDSDERPAILRVRDSGSGVSETINGSIFEPFFTTKPPGVGTGLGLSSVHGIVTAAGGTIEVQSEPSAGAEFTIRLPLATG